MRRHAVTAPTAPTYRRAGAPAAGTRAEVWTRTSADGAWTFERSEDTGTVWSVRHNATGYVMRDAFTSLRDAGRAVATGLVWRMLYDDAQLRLRTAPDGPSVSPVSPNDEARALLTWMVEQANRLTGIGDPLDGVAPTR